jgi:hypothetical protein
MSGGNDGGAVIAILMAALEKIAQPLDCGCKPCTGQCRSEYSLGIELEERREIARNALSTSSQVREVLDFGDAIDPNASWNRRGAGAALPDIELVSAKVHEAWIQSKAAQGVRSRKSETGEELIAPYETLSESAKDLDRGTVRSVYDAILRARTGGDA